MRTSPLYLGLALAIGIAIGSAFWGEPSKDAPPVAAKNANPVDIIRKQYLSSDPAGDVEIDNVQALNQMFRNEINARRVLEQKIIELSIKVTDLEEKSASSAAFVATDQAEETGESILPGADQSWFNEQALIDSGMSSSQARELRINFERLEMERLYLRDQSIREGWDRDKFREALQALTSREDELESALSESEYDSYLYASGQTNRVAVTSVLESAPAASAGIESGDLIIRYDNQRIYNWRELREATSSGAIGDTVAVEVDRDGQTIDLYLTRGPLGIRMNSLSVAP